MRFRHEWGEKPREPVTVMLLLYGDKSDLPSVTSALLRHSRSRTNHPTSYMAGFSFFPVKMTKQGKNYTFFTQQVWFFPDFLFTAIFYKRSFPL